MIPITFAVGMAFDFTQAQARKDKLDGIADVAALGGRDANLDDAEC